jgi:pimeloyl-ACP methyl ester carboxylesterase
MIRIILILAGTATLIYAALCLALFLWQRSFLYYPQPKSADNNCPTLTLNVNGEHILVSTRPKAGAGAVIYFGGNAEDVFRSLPGLGEAFPDRAIYALNYRGYGGSTGKPSESGLIADAIALYDQVRLDHSHIILIGRSLGSGIAVRVASERPTERLVLITPYRSLSEIGANQFPYFPVRWLMLDKFESWRYAPKVTAPTQLIAAQNDEVIPASSTTALYKCFAPSLVNLSVIPGVGHNTISESPEYIALLRGTP